MHSAKYLSVNSQSVVIHMAPVSTVHVFNLYQNDKSAAALKPLLETNITIKIFFDAHMPAKFLFDCSGVKLANKVRCTQYRAKGLYYMRDLGPYRTSLYLRSNNDGTSLTSERQWLGIACGA